MTVFEHLGRLLIVDCGVLFPGHDEPGVDLILPDLRHIEDRLDDVEALVLTHAHEDHIGAIPFLLKLRPDIPRRRLEVHAGAGRGEVPRTPHQAGVRRSRRGAEQRARRVRVRVLRTSTTRFPAAWRSRSTPARARCCTPGDIKLDQLPLDGRPTDLPGMSRLGDAGRRPVPVRLDELRDPRRRPVGKRDRAEHAPADPRRRRPGHRRLLRLQCRSGATDHRRRRWRWAARCRSSAGRWCATWGSPRSSATSTSTTTTSSTSAPRR